MVDITMDDTSPYLLFTPGPLSTTGTVRAAMKRELSTWDPDYNELCDVIRRRLVDLAVAHPSSRPRFTAVLMQGSGTFTVESVIGSVIPPSGKLLVAVNGAYGRRMVQIAERLRIDCVELQHEEHEPVDPDRLAAALSDDDAITHVAYVHCETTTGLLHDGIGIGEVVSSAGRCLLIDAMSSFGGVPFDMEALRADYVVSSANKCIQGVPGFGFVIANRENLASTGGWARSVSLDLHDQWQVLEEQGGKLRFTSPTHVVHAFHQALDELDAEGGVSARNKRLVEIQNTLVAGMAELGFQTLLPSHLQSPVITTFLAPYDPAYSFPKFFEELKARGFFIYPGKITRAESFRIGSIGNITVDDMRNLLSAIGEVKERMGFSAAP